LTQDINSAQTYVIADCSVTSGPRDNNPPQQTITTITSIAADFAAAKNAHYGVCSKPSIEGRL
jgi:hypothetical protein